MFRVLRIAERIRPSVSIAAAKAATRAFANVVPKNEPKDLTSVVLRELAYEKEDDSSAKALVDIKKALSSEWKVDAPLGGSQISLTKDNIRLDLDITAMPLESEEPENEEENEDDGGQEGYRMVVTIGNDKGKSMRFACMVSDALTIHHAQVFETSKLPSVCATLDTESSPYYSGPNFEELDTNLQNSFYDYLASK